MPGSATGRSGDGQSGRDRRGRRSRRPRRRDRDRRGRTVGRGPRPGARAESRRPGLLVARRPLPDRQPRAAPAAHPRFARPRPAGLVRHGRLRPARGLLAAPLGRGLSRLCGGREAVLAQRDGPPHLSRGRLGRARRRSRLRPRQFGAALPRHLGHGAGRRRALRAPGPRGRGDRPPALPVAPSGRSSRRDERRRHRPCRHAARTEHGAARRGLVPDRDRRIRNRGGRGDRRLGRHRRRSRARSPELARPPRPPAGHDGGGRAGACRRAHDRHHRRSRRARHQPGPDVALRRRHPELGSRLAEPRHPHSARTVLDVVRRDRPAPARALSAGLRHARHARASARDRPRLQLVHPRPEHHQEGVRAVGLRAEPGPDRPRLAPRPRARGRQARDRARGGLQGEGRGFRGRERSRDTRRRHEPDRRQRPSASRGDRARDRGPRPRGGQSLLEGRAGDGHPERPSLSRRQADPHGPPAPHPRSGTRAAHRGPPPYPDPQDARRPRNRPRWPRPRPGGEVVPGLYAAGEASGFGGGGMHGYAALEGTFLGGCLFSGREAGRAAAKAV